jgi:hypothetical protein
MVLFIAKWNFGTYSSEVPISAEQNLRKPASIFFKADPANTAIRMSGIT